MQIEADADGIQARRPLTFIAREVLSKNNQFASWDFGDGESASGTEVVHTYALAGVYRVSMNVGGAVTRKLLAVDLVEQWSGIAPGSLAAPLGSAADTHDFMIQTTGEALVVEAAAQIQPAQTLVISLTSAGETLAESRGGPTAVLTLDKPPAGAFTVAARVEGSLDSVPYNASMRVRFSGDSIYVVK